MMSPVISLPWATPLLRSFTNPEVLAASVYLTTMALMIDLVHQKLSKPLQLKHNNLLPFSEAHLHNKLKKCHGLINKHLKALVNRRKKKFQRLDQDLSQVLSTLVTHQEESPISPWAELMSNWFVQIYTTIKRCLLNQNII